MHISPLYLVAAAVAVFAIVLLLYATWRGGEMLGTFFDRQHSAAAVPSDNDEDRAMPGTRRR